MSIHKNEEQTQQQTTTSSLLDTLYCEEEKWEDADSDSDADADSDANADVEDEEEHQSSPSPSPFLLLEQDLFWEDKDLVTLFTKEQEQQITSLDSLYLTKDRKEAVNWIIKVNTHYKFSTLSALLGITYLDKFISSYSLQREKPWMLQLIAVACLSLAAKVEETQVPLLLDFQVTEETKYIFEAKTIQRMELLVLSTLKWKMHLITPISFIDHIIRRLGLKNNAHWEFLKKSHHLLLSVTSDSRFVGYRPSVIAAATMMRIIEKIEAFEPVLYQIKLLDVLNFTMDDVKSCYDLILELPEDSGRKRKSYESSSLTSPSCVIDFNSDSSSDSWSENSYSSSSSKKKKKKMMHLSCAIVATP